MLHAGQDDQDSKPISSTDVRTKTCSKAEPQDSLLWGPLYCIVGSMLGSSACKLEQSKKKKEASAKTAWFCIFPFCFLITVWQPVSAERTSKDCVCCRAAPNPMFISTYLLQTHSPQASKPQGDLFALLRGEASVHVLWAGLQLQVWPKSPCYIFRNLGLLFPCTQKKEVGGFLNVWG